MPHQFSKSKLCRFGACSVLCLYFAFLLPPEGKKVEARLQEAVKPDPWRDFKYEEASACKQCHGLPTKDHSEKGALDLVLMAEYPIWKTYDKHAQAYAVLEGPRSQRMGKLLFGEEGDNWKRVLKEEGGCLSCHAMHNLSKENQAKGAGKGLDPMDGVSCGGCHGPSSAWRGMHDNKEVWRNMSPEDKHAKGLRDLRDPLVRAEVCLSCHIGNASEGKVVTHAMFAAGHPPLPPIEISSFSRNEPQHWRDVKAVPVFQKNMKDEKVRKNYHLNAADFQRSRFALIGNVVALRETMKLAHDRANLKAEQPAMFWPELLTGLAEVDTKDADKLRTLASRRWPEVALAHTDCYACHHELDYPGYRQARGFGYQLHGKPAIRSLPGRPLVRLWPLSLVEGNVSLVNRPIYLDELQTRLTDLSRTSGTVPFGRPDELRRDTARVVQWCDQLLVELKEPSVFTKESARRLLSDLCKMHGPSSDLTPDYEIARQVVYEESYSNDERDEKVMRLFTELTEKFDLEPFKLRDQRGKIVLGIVRKAIKQEKVEGMDEFASFASNVNDPEVFKKFASAQPSQFLLLLQAGVSNADFTKGFLEKVDELQALSDQEERMMLESMFRYNPTLFKLRMSELSKLLPKP